MFATATKTLLLKLTGKKIENESSEVWKPREEGRREKNGVLGFYLRKLHLLVRHGI